MKLVVEKNNLRSVARKVVIELVLCGAAKPGDRLNETHLAQEIGISQTPVREALLSLESESFLSFEPNRGFRVRELSIAEIDDIYPLMALLESFALELICEFSSEQIAELRSINGRLLKAKSPRAACKADRQFHEKLLENCPNKLVKLQIESVRRSAYRYELAFMKTRRTFERSVLQHEKILAALSKGKIDTAMKWLEKNSLMTMKPLKNWLNEFEQKSLG